MNTKLSIYSFTLERLTEALLGLGLKKHNAIQIYQWIYQKNVTSFNVMTNIAKSSLKILNDNFNFSKFSTLQRLIDDKDETTKFLYELEDGQKIETVLMKFDYGYSLCISSQVGCNMGCKFCASGLLRKIRNLEPHEMVLQHVETQKYLTKLNGSKITNMVVMGIGEPFDNYDNLKMSLEIFNNHHGIGLGSRHITVSTCGIVPKIEQFANDFPQINLAISLHAPNDKLRSEIMPINYKYDINHLVSGLTKYLLITNRRISFEYVLLGGINDKDEHINELGKLLRGFLCYVNIITYNGVKENNFRTSTRAQAFVDGLSKYQIMATKRLERGTKIMAACGQLRANAIK